MNPLRDELRKIKSRENNGHIISGRSEINKLYKSNLSIKQSGNCVEVEKNRYDSIIGIGEIKKDEDFVNLIGYMISDYVNDGNNITIFNDMNIIKIKDILTTILENNDE